MNQEGAVLVKFTVSREGRPENIEAKSPRSEAYSPHSRLLRDEAVSAVSEWKFEPALKDKSPVATSCTWIFIFRLSEL
jgi:TonB family protein